MEQTDNTKFKNTVAKGDALEDASADLLRKLLSSGDFFLPEKHSKLYQKKKYYSETRKADVIFDIAIETTMPGAPTYSLLTLIECKNYNRAIEVEKIEAFDSKVRSIGEHNTRAILMTNNALQSAAYETAVSKKIAVIRLLSNDQYQWINYRKKRDFSVDLKSAKHMFIDEFYKSAHFVGLLNNKVFDNIPDLLIEGKIMDYYIHSERFVNIPYVKEERFEEIVNRLDTHDVRYGASIDVEKLCRFLQTVYPVTFDFNTVMPNGILGKITFDPLQIFISASLKADEHKFRFTLLHEIAHLILHTKLLEGVSETSDSETTLFMENYTGKEQIKRLEFQANKLASYLLVPTGSLLMIASRYFKLNNIHKGHLYLDHQPVNQKLVNGLLYTVADAFNVSYSVAKIRLVELKLIKEQASLSIRSIARNQFR